MGLSRRMDGAYGGSACILAFPGANGRYGHETGRIGSHKSTVSGMRRAMQRKKVLFLDLDPTGGSSDTLQRILACAPAIDTEVSSLSPAFGTASSGDREHTEIRFEVQHDLIFVLITGRLIHQAATLVKSIRRCNTEVPLIIVIDSMEPDDLWDLLELGASDFVTHPLRALDILPRVRRLWERRSPAEKVTQALKEKLGLAQLLGQSPSFLAQLHSVTSRS